MYKNKFIYYLVLQNLIILIKVSSLIPNPADIGRLKKKKERKTNVNLLGKNLKNNFCFHLPN